MYKKCKPLPIWSKSENYATPIYSKNISATVAKSGAIDNHYVTMSDFLYIDKLDPLPENYTANTFQLDVKINYYKYAGAKLYTKKPVVKQISPVKAEITIAKNASPSIIGHFQLGILGLQKALTSFVEHGSDSLPLIIGIPAWIIAFSGSLVVIPVTAILFGLLGGDWDDLYW